MIESLDKKILTLIETSTVPDSLKATIKTSLSDFSDGKKSKVYKTLLAERKKMNLIDKEEDKLIRKYKKIFDKARENPSK